MGSRWPRRLSSLLFVLVLAVTACRADRGGERPRSGEGMSRPPQESRRGEERGQRRWGRGERQPTAVSLVRISRRDLADVLELSGTLEAKRQVALTPRIAGRLAEIRVEMGDRVRAGQVLARLDATDLESRVHQAEAALAATQAGLRREQVVAASAERQLRTGRALLARDFVARQEVEDDAARLDEARAAVRAAEADLARQRATVAEARTALSQATLVAPMAGLVARRHADPGALVTASMPVVTLVAPDPLETAVFVPEAALPRIRPGTPATVSVDALPGTVFRGAVARVSPVVTPETREAQVAISVGSRGGALRPGMFARVSLRLALLERTPALPQEALVLRQGVEGVFLAEGDKARFQPVKTGLRSGAWVAIAGGLPPGARVVTLGNHLLQDGSPIVGGGHDRAAPRKTHPAGPSRGPRAPRD